jgi:hypothetical protein
MTDAKNGANFLDISQGEMMKITSSGNWKTERNAERFLKGRIGSLDINSLRFSSRPKIFRVRCHISDDLVIQDAWWRNTIEIERMDAYRDIEVPGKFFAARNKPDDIPSRDID